MPLSALFYPKGTPDKPISFDSLYIPYIYKEIYLEGVYIDLMNLKKDLVILDVGANIGCVTQYMREHAKKIYAIEPSPEHFEALKKNKEFNNWDNVELFNIAIAGSDGEMELTMNDNNRTMNSLNIGKKINETTHELKPELGSEGKMFAEGYNNAVVVKTITFNTLFKENKIEMVDFCKFDVEGAEESILCSPAFADIAPKIKSMMVEFHYPSFPKIVDHMIDLGYTAKRYPSSAVIFLFEHA